MRHARKTSNLRFTKSPTSSVSGASLLIGGALITLPELSGNFEETPGSLNFSGTRG